MHRLTCILTIGLTGLLLSGSITEKKKFKGDLYFKLITIGSYYEADSVLVSNFDKTLDSLMKLDRRKLSKDNLELVNVYGGLKKHGLIDKPFFDLRVDATTTYIVYANPGEFNKIKNFKREDLIREYEKVEIELTGEIVNLGTINVINCLTIDKVLKVKGETHWIK